MLGGLAVVALASSPAKARSAKLSRQECITKWADHLARLIDGETDPAKVGVFASVAHASGWEQARACLDARAAELAAGEPARSCYEILYPILLDDFSNIRDPEVAYEIAEQAEAAGLPAIEACFIAYGRSL